MTVTTTTNKAVYNGTGAQTIFPYPYKIFLASDLQVFIGGVLKVITADYTVDNVGNPAGGNVTMVVAPPPGTGNVVIVRVEPITQGTSYPINDKFPASAHEAALDKLTMIAQQLNAALSAVPTLAPTSTFSNLLLDDPVLGQFLFWKTAGGEIGSSPLTAAGLLPDPVTLQHGGTGLIVGSFAALLAGIGAATQFTPVVLTHSANVTIDASLGDYFTLVPQEAFTLKNPTNPSNGKRIVLRVKQDGVGGRVITFDTKFRFGTDLTTAVLTTGPNKTDYLGFVYDTIDDKWDVTAFVKGF